ncbi:hypothetical protein ACWEWU_13205 [Staphylococcus xylosus]
MSERNRKPSQNDLIEIVWKDFRRLLDDINRTFHLIFNLFMSLIVVISLLLIILTVLLLLFV